MLHFLHLWWVGVWGQGGGCHEVDVESAEVYRLAGGHGVPLQGTRNPMLMCLTSGQPGHQQSGVPVHCLISCSQAVPCWRLLMVAAEHKCQHTMTWYTVGQSLSENRSMITHIDQHCHWLCIVIMLASRHVLMGGHAMQ